MDNLKSRLLLWSDRLAGLLLALALVTLPVTSLPLLSRLTGGTQVAPPAMLFVFLAVLVWMPAWFLIRKGRLPAEANAFLAFLVVAILACLAAFFLPVSPYKGRTPLKAEISALITLAIGSAFYLVFSAWCQDGKRLKTCLQMLNLGGLLIIAWGALQAAIIYLRDGDYPAWMINLQALLTLRPLVQTVFSLRVTAFAYEPSWLGHMLNLVYIPLWLGATVSGYTAYRRKIGRISVENILLVGGVILLVLTLSRIGLFALLLVAAFLVLHLSLRLIDHILGRQEAKKAAGMWQRRLLKAAMLAGMLLVYAVLAVGALYIVSRLDVRLERLFSYGQLPANLLDMAKYMVFAERLTYWQAGWSLFAQHPLLGVGLGNAGFFFQANLPADSRILNEILYTIHVADFLPNVKSIWLRILAETGMVGFGFYAVWLYILWLANRMLRSMQDPLLRTMGWMGAFSTIAYLLDGFNVDTFALPYIWVALGLVSAASAFSRSKGRETG